MIRFEKQLFVISIEVQQMAIFLNILAELKHLKQRKGEADLKCAIGEISEGHYLVLPHLYIPYYFVKSV